MSSSSSDLHSSTFQPPTTLTNKEPLLHSPPPMAPPNRSKTVSSYPRFIRKFLFITFFLISLPMFPSRAPDTTILTQFWELLHLIFIGVALAYGLFSTRRNLEIESMETEIQSNLYDSQSYGSSLFSNSSYFNGECDNNPYVYSPYFVGGITNGYAKPRFENVDQNVVQTWNSRYYQGQSMVMVADGNCVVDEFNNNMPRSMMTACVSPLGLPVRNLKTSPESHELSGVSDSDSSSDDSRSGEFGDFDAQNWEGIVEENVPVPSTIQRSLRSIRVGIRDDIARGPSHCRPLSVDEIQFEALKSPSFQYTGSDPLSHGNSMKTEMAENGHFAAEQPSNFTHIAVDETQVESLLDSFRSGSFSSQDSSPSRLSPLRSASSLHNSNTEDIRKRKNSRKLHPPPNSTSAMNNSDSQELPNSSMENVRRRKSFQQSYPPASTMNNKVPPRNDAGGSTHHRRLHFKPLSDDEARFDPLQSQSFRSIESSSSPSSQCSETSYSPIRLSPSHTVSPEPPNSKAEELHKEKISRRTSPPLHSRHYSMLDTDMHQSFEDEPNDFSGGEYQKLGSRSLKWDSSCTKASPRGRSVRTIRPDKYTEKLTRAGEVNRNHVKNTREKTYHGILQAGYSSNASGGIDKLSFGPSDKKLDSSSSPTNPIIRGRERREKHEHSENSTAAGSKENSDTETGTFDTNLDELGTASHVPSECGQGPNEVDKKAGEFIAKFREQIRLQKVSSFDSTQGLNIRNSIFR